MKLLLTSSSFKGGGITSYALEFISAYADSIQMCVMIGDDSLYPLNKYNVKVYRYEMSDTTIGNAKKVINVINNEIKPDVIVNSCASLITLILPFLNNNIKIINVSHSLRYNEADYAGYNSDYTDSIIALSNYNKQYLEKTFNCHSKISVVLNFVHELSEQAIILRKKINNKIPVIVFSGGGTSSKSPEIIYRVVNELLKTDLDFKFYWMGNTTPPLKKIQPFKEIKDILPIDSRLIITGRVSREQAMKITNEANIFITPSRREGCPMSLIEAMRIGTIPITSDYNNGCKEIIRDGYNGYVIPHHDTMGFVDRIIDIIKNPDHYIDIYYNSYKTYKKELSFEVWKNKMDVLLYQRGVSHTTRLDKLDSKLYKHYKKRMASMTYYNMIHLIFFEYLPSALPFTFFYFKHKIKKTTKHT